METKKKLLVITPVTPYDSIKNAGGKTLNYYLKKFSKIFDMMIVSLVWDYELSDIESATNWNMRYKVIGTSLTDKLFRRLYDWSFFFNPYDKYINITPQSHINLMMAVVQELKSEGYYPDVIDLEFTGTILWIEKIKAIFPKSKYIGSEVDVTYLKFKREFELSPTRIKKSKYERCKIIELEALRNCDMIVTQNEKDASLLVKDGINRDNIFVFSPYYSSIERVGFNPDSKMILFFGAMDRKENYLSAIWFINNVMPKLPEYIFRVVGGNPPDELKKHSSDNVRIEGFVEDINEVFKNSLCMVAPLLLGAGIKVKVIESMSCGLVTLTNEIGIEGIPANPGNEYIYCKTAENYIDAIKELSKGSLDGYAISENAYQFVRKNFNLQKSISQYSNVIEKL